MDSKQEQVTKYERRINEYKLFNSEQEKNWNGPFYFIQGADCQFGLIAKETLKEVSWKEEIILAEKCVEIINSLNPEPKFFIICGDMCDAMPHEWNIRQEQEKDFYAVFNKVKKSIKLLCVCGNHDVGNQPDKLAVDRYRSSFGDDFYSFWCGGVMFIVLNSQYYYDGSLVPELAMSQDEWLEKQLEISANSKIGPVVFQHIPLFLNDPNSKDEDYFCLNYPIRMKLLNKLYRAGGRYVLCGHYHRNALGMYKDLQCIVTSAIGYQLGNDESGFRIVKVQENKLEHEYFGFKHMPLNIM